MLPNEAPVEYYVDSDGDSPFAEWFDTLEPGAAARLAAAIDRIGRGAISNVKGVGEGVLEFGSTPGRAIESTSGVTVTGWSFCWGAGPSVGRNATSGRLGGGGPTTRLTRAPAEDGERQWP
jgi:hypothetical protein